MIPLNSNIMKLQRSGIRRFTNMAKETPDCVMLTIGKPDFETPQPIRDAAWAALQAGQTHYAPNQGIPTLRKAIADFETRRGFPCAPEQVLVTVGATGALYTALTGLLNPGDEVVIPTPAFSLYESIALAAGAVPVPLDLSKTGFQIEERALATVLSPRTRAVILNSPNNPTGVVLNDDSLAAVKRAVLGKPIWLICDNVYQQLSEGNCPDLSLDAELREQVLLCQSFSKPYAMTGWRAGYLIGPREVMDRLLLLHAAEVAAVPTFIQSACVTALTVDPAPMAEVYAKRRGDVCRRLDEMGLTYPKPRGAFYVFPDISRFGLDSETFCTRMIREAKVAAVPGSCFGTDGYIRLSCCYADEALRKGLDRLEQFLDSLKGGSIR